MKKVKYNEEDIVGHHAVAAVIKNKNGKILMQEHAKYGFWTLPIGKVKQGQDIEEGLKQEIKEECNLKLKKIKEIARKDYDYVRDGNKVRVTGHLFEVLDYDGEMKNNEPHKHIQQIFLSLDKIMNAPYLSDMTVLYLETLGFKREAKIEAD